MIAGIEFILESQWNEYDVIPAKAEIHVREFRHTDRANPNIHQTSFPRSGNPSWRIS